MRQPVLRHLTQADLEILEQTTGQRFELWQGQPVAMTGGTLKHNLIALGLRDALKPQIKAGCRISVADVKLRFDQADDSDTVYPDVMVVCEPQAGSSYQTQPILLAEVLSDSSVRRDRVDKRAAYTALESVQAYLILSQHDIGVDLYQRTNQWQRERYQGIESVIQIATLDIQIALQTVYADVLSDLGY